MTDDEISINLSVEAWKKTIDVQQHFNEICMKIRNVYATLLAALFALVGLLETRAEDLTISALGYEIHSILFILFGIFSISMLFYFLDRHWYHRLLVGAVLNGLEIEKHLAGKALGFQLTSKIGDNSALDITENTMANWMLWGVAKILGAEVTNQKVKNQGDKKLLRSDAKIAIFYKSVAYASLIALVVIVFFGGVVSLDQG